MDCNNSAANPLIWSKKNSSKNGWRWFLAGTLLNLTVTSLIVGSMLFYVHVELQSVKDQLLSHEDRLFILEKHVTTNDATLQQGTPEVNVQTAKKAQLRMRRDHEPQMSTEHRTEGNMTFQSGIHTSQTEPLHGLHSPVLTCRDGKDGRDGRDGKNGEVGRDGVDGRDGKDGNDGRDGRDLHPVQADSPLPPIGPGQPGEPGPPGEQGPPGDRGIPGERGRHGESGPSGETGPPGRPGDPGEIGPKGFDGLSGVAGLPGKPGISGPRGFRGMAGPSGETGNQGESGISGPRGFPGPSGETGLPGESGRPGERGQRGEPGLPGQQGRESSGPTYIRWGRTTCSNQAGTELVYQGYGAGAHYLNKGGTSDLICLPTDPDVPASYKDGHQNESHIYGIKYKVPEFDPFSHENSEVLHNHDVPCAVCRLTSRGTQVLLPAKNECPDNWTKEYKGYLMSAYYSRARQQAVCVDEAPEITPGSQTLTDGALLYLMETACRSLPCPPYVAGREISCTVCSI